MNDTLTKRFRMDAGRESSESKKKILHVFIFPTVVLQIGLNPSKKIKFS